MRTSFDRLRNPWLQLAISQLCTLAADLCLKLGANATVHISPKWSWTGLTGLASPLVWLGIVFMILSFVTWLYVLRHLPLSLAFPMSQAVHVMVPIASLLFLGEQISLIRWCGIAFVVLGLIVVAKPVATLEERL
jgi:drug/metabolite transporter (DMT)-like permease